MTWKILLALIALFLLAFIAIIDRAYRSNEEDEAERRGRDSE